MPKQVFKFKGFEKGLIDKADKLDFQGLKTAKNVMVDYQGKIRPASFSGTAISKSSVDNLVTYNIESGTISVHIWTNTISTNSQFADSTYHIKYTYLFTDNQESPLYNVGTISLDDSHNLKINIDDFTLSGNIIGIRLYCKEESVGDDWYYLGTSNGQVFSSSVESDAVSVFDNINEHYLVASNLPPITYEAINGYKSDVDSLGLISGNEQDQTMANNRVFAIPTSDQTKIFYSQPGKYASFPRYNDYSGNVLDPVVSNSNGKALVSFGDVLVHCTANDISFISVSGMPSQWQVTKVYRNQAVSNVNHILTSDDGIFWVNSNGCYYSNGQKIQELSTNIEWDGHNFDADNISDIKYYPYCNYIKVTDTNNNYLAYNTRTKSWVEGGSDTTSQVVKTNLSFLGAPHYKKKVYTVYVTYTTINQVAINKAVVSVFGDGVEKSTTIKTTHIYSANINTTVFELDSPVVANTCSVEINWDNLVTYLPEDFTVNDISIEYRPLKAKRV